MTPSCAQTFMKSLPIIGTAAVCQELALTHDDGEQFVVRLQASCRSTERTSFEPIDVVNFPLAGISAKALTSICRHKSRRAARTVARDALVLLGRLHRVAGRMGGLSHPILTRSALPFLGGALITSEKGFPFVPITDSFVMVGTDWVPEAAMTSRDRDVAAVWSGLLSRPKATIDEVWGWDAFETSSCELEFENE
jgi:hypothetical protein